MYFVNWSWRPWDQARSVDNARTASKELSRARTERDDITAFVEDFLARKRKTQSA